MSVSQIKEVLPSKIAISTNWQPMSEKALLIEIEEANTQIENGVYLNIEDLEQEMKQW